MLDAVTTRELLEELNRRTRRFPRACIAERAVVQQSTRDFLRFLSPEILGYKPEDDRD